MVKREVEEHIDKIQTKKSDAIDRTKWHDGVNELSESGHFC